MAKGGKRPGAGRKKGVPNKATQARLAKAAAAASLADGKPDGILPTDVMLEAMLLHYRLAKYFEGSVDEDNPEAGAASLTLAISHMTSAAKIAQDAAPYFHSRLATVTHSGPDGGPIKHQHEFSDIELAQRVAFIFERAARAKKED